MQVLDLPRCPACGTGRFDHFELDPGAPLRRCQACATVSAPTYAHPDEIYGDGYMFGSRGSFGTDVRHPSVQAYLARVADRRVRMVERATGARAGSLLDVGCGTGEGPAAARVSPRGGPRHARPGGAVVVEVPNWRGVPRRRLGGSWRDLRPGEHLAYFTPRTLAAVMRASGIVPVAVRTPAYVGPPQTLDHALADLVRHGRYRRLLEPLSRVRTVDGVQ